MTGTRFQPMCIVLAAFVLCMSAAQVFANSLAIFRTTLGEVTVELYDQDKPITVRNFIRLTEMGAYHNSILHRCATGFVAQGGGYYVIDPSSTNIMTPPFVAPNLGFVTNEFNVGPWYSNVFGTIAMAKGATPDSAQNEWFFNLADNSANLDYQKGGFTVFGRILTGTNVLLALDARSYTNGIVNLTNYFGGGASMFSTLPVTYTGDRPPQFNELIYTEIEILQLAAMRQPDGTRLFAWNSPSTMVCRVEYSDTGVDGSWNTLHVTNGNGQIQFAADTNGFAQTRSYRIRAE